MPEQVTQQPTQVAPAVSVADISTQPTTETASPQIKVDDIVKRISTAKEEKPQQTDITQQFKLDEIKDPVAKSIVEKKIKDLESGYNKKYMDLAEQRKQVEQLKQQVESQNTWTPERIQQLLKDPNFNQAAQAVYQSQAQASAPVNWEGTPEQWSALSDSDKRAFTDLQGKVNSLLSQQEQMRHAQEHERVKSRFPDYQPQMVESFQKDILDGRVNDEQIKELIWKAKNFEKYVDNAYRFGLEDRNGNLQEKLNGSTQPSGMKVEQVGEKPMRAEGERTSSFIARLARWNMSQRK